MCSILPIIAQHIYNWELTEIIEDITAKVNKTGPFDKLIKDNFENIIYYIINYKKVWYYRTRVTYCQFLKSLRGKS
jgi:hypothetical protein